MGNEAFIWTEQTGVRSLKAVLENDFGLDLTGWSLTVANDVSQDGLTIVGNGINPQGDPEAWVATIPESSTLVLGFIASFCLMHSRLVNRS